MSAGNRNPKTMPQNKRKYGSDESPPQSRSIGFDYSLNIKGDVVHFYGELGACSSQNQITVSNSIYCGNGRPRSNDKLKEEMSEDANVSKGNDQLKAPLNNSRNNKSSVFHQELKGKVHQELNGQVIHHYNLLGYGCQNNNIDISNPIIGLKLGKLDTSSGSGSNPNKINDLMYLVPNPKPKMQTQNYGRCSDYKYSQTGSQSYHECRGIKNTTYTISSNLIHNQRDADVIKGNDQLKAPLNNSRNNKSSVFHQEPKGKVHQKPEGKEIHQYNVQGYGGQYNNSDTSKPILGFDLGELAHQVPGVSNGHPIVIKKDNFSFIGAYSNKCKFNFWTEDHPDGLFYQSNLVTASNYPQPGIHLSEGIQFHDYALLGSYSNGSSFNLANHTPRVNRHAQDRQVRCTAPPPYINYSLTMDGWQFHNYGLVGSSCTNTWFNFNNDITFSHGTSSGMSQTRGH